MVSVQQNYRINPSDGFPGVIAEPNSPHRIEAGILNVPTGATRANPRPGDSLRYNTTNNGWEVPSDADGQLVVGGILTYRQDGMATSTSVVQFDDGDEIFIVTMGVVWVIGG